MYVKNLVILIIFIAEMSFSISQMDPINNLKLKRIRRNLDSFLEKPHVNSSTSDDIYSLLKEIKDILSDKVSTETSWQKAFDTLNHNVQSSINNIQNQIDNRSKSSNQKIDILQNAFSGLEVHLTSDSKTLDDTRTRVTRAEDRILQLEKKAKVNKEELENVNTIENVRSDWSVTPINSHLIADTLSASVPESPLISSIELVTENSSKNKTEILGKDENDIIYLKEKLSNLTDEIKNLKITITLNSLLISETRDKNKNIDQQISNLNINNSCSCLDDVKNLIDSLQINLNDLKSKHDTLWVSSNESFVDSAKILAQMKIRSDYLESKILSMESILSELMTSASEFSKYKKDINILRDKIDNMEESFKSSLEMATNNFEQRDIMVSNVKKDICVYPYMRRAGSCFYISKDKRLNWEESRKHCQELQGDLAAPKDFELFRQFVSDQKLSRSYTYWIGGSDINTEDDWQWVDGRKIQMGHGLWATDQPNEGKSANCLGIRLSSRVIGAMDDDCSQPNYFICEQEQT